LQPSAGLPGFGAIPKLSVVSEQRSALGSCEWHLVLEK